MQTSAGSSFRADAMAATPTLSIGTPAAPPHWALLERELLNGISEGCAEFFEHYFDEKTGYGLWTPRWGGNDGPDDGAENGLNWTILYALGAPEEILQLWRKGWEGHLKQYTEAHTIEASPEAASTGMYYKEWNAQFDYFHHTEGMSSFTLQGLAEPYDPKFIQRTRTYAAMYMGDDPVGASSSLRICAGSDTDAPSAGGAELRQGEEAHPLAVHRLARPDAAQSHRPRLGRRPLGPAGGGRLGCAEPKTPARPVPLFGIALD